MAHDLFRNYRFIVAQWN